MKSVGQSGVKKVAGFCADFKAFIMRGNVVDLAVGVIIGAAFSAVVSSMVADIIGPIIGLATPGGTLDESFVVLRHGKDATIHTYPTVESAKAAGAITLNYGKFIQTVINFLIIAFCLFLIIKLIYAIYKKDQAVSTDWPCPKCKEMVKKGAVRCSHCTAEPISPEIGDGTQNDAENEPLTQHA